MTATRERTRGGRAVVELVCDRCRHSTLRALVDPALVDRRRPRRWRRWRGRHAWRENARAAAVTVFGWQRDEAADVDVCPACVEPGDVTGKAGP